MKITDYTNEKGRGYLNNKMSAVDMEIWAVLPPHPLCHDLDLFPCLFREAGDANDEPCESFLSKLVCRKSR
jgi:hypothetical protein